MKRYTRANLLTLAQRHDSVICSRNNGRLLHLSAIKIGIQAAKGWQRNPSRLGRTGGFFVGVDVVVLACGGKRDNITKMTESR